MTSPQLAERPTYYGLAKPHPDPPPPHPPTQGVIYVLEGVAFQDG
jgi:hypothetical protein